MHQVSFQEEQAIQVAPTASASPRMAQWVLRMGFAKDIKGAERVLIATALLCILAALATIVLAGRTTGELTPAQQQEIRQKIERGEIPYTP